MFTSIAELRNRWQRGETTSNGWLVLPEPLVAEAASRSGFDTLCIDMQHGLIDFLGAVRLLQATTASGVPTLVRVPWNEPSMPMRVLDAGAAGVIVPMIETAADARAVVAACRYPPGGQRSFGPARASMLMAEYADEADATVLVFVMIETRSALDHLDEILDTPGLDGVYVGPADLSLALGFPPETDSARPEHQAAIQRVVARCHERGLVVGLHTAGPPFARRAAAWGVDFVTIATDLSALRSELRSRIAAFQRASVEP